MQEAPVILAIESSCDDTSAAVSRGFRLLSHGIAGQTMHARYGGVVPELASREHQKNIVWVVDDAMHQAGVRKEEIDVVAFTCGPGLLGSLLVGVSFAKAFAMARDLPLIDVHHLEAHIMAHFIEEQDNPKPAPGFPFLCLTVSGGHTQIVLVEQDFRMEVIGSTLDDAAGEALDKAAKVLGLPYPGGPEIDALSREGNPHAFVFPHPATPGLNFSFSGLKTSFLYLIRDEAAKNAGFIHDNKADLAASYQFAITGYLVQKLTKAAKKTGIREIALAGGVSANSALRELLNRTAEENRWNLYLPRPAFCTDNAAMIAAAGYVKFKKGHRASFDISAFTG